MSNLHLDIETGDPDDLWTLALTATHPKLNLKTVSVYPGRPDQIGLVRKVLKLVGREDVLIGANLLKDDKKSVGKYYYKWLGDIPEEAPDVNIPNLYRNHIVNGTDLITGGPLKNIHSILEYHIHDSSRGGVLFRNWTAQGGFVGCNIIPDNEALEKFRGKEVMATYNLGGHKNSAQYLMNEGSQNFNSIKMCGKNVCHGFVFNKEDVESLPKGKHDGLDIMIQGMEKYCEKKPEGKAMHDILAALLHINPNHGKWVCGQPYREKGKWGFKEYKMYFAGCGNEYDTEYDTNIEALVSVDKESVMKELW